MKAYFIGEKMDMENNQESYRDVSGSLNSEVQIILREPVLFLSKKDFKKMLGMSAPLMLSHLTNMLGGFGNVYLFSRLSAKSLAAAGLITTTQNIFSASLGGSLFACSILMTEERAQAAPDFTKLGKLWRQTQLLTLVYSGGALLLFLVMDKILLQLGQDATLLTHLQNYFNYYGIAFTGALLNFGNQQILLSHRTTVPILIINTANNLASFGLGYLFIERLYSWQESTVSFAYAISSWTSACFSSLYIFHKYRQDRLLSLTIKPFFSALGKLLKKGLPMGLQNGAEVIALWGAMLMAGKFGDVDLTAAEIAGQYVYILTVPGFALGQVTMILSAEQYTKKNYKALRHVGFRAMVIPNITYAWYVIVYKRS